MLLQHLPRESAYVQAVAGDEVRWGATEYLLAALIDAIQVGNYQRARAHFKGKPNPPKPILRPGDRSPDRLGGRQVYTRDEMRRMLDHWGEGVVDMIETTEVI